LAQAGPDNWRIEYPAESGGGVCPRGSTIGELLNHYGRILTPARRPARQSRPGPAAAWRGGDLQPLDLPSAMGCILEAAAERKIVLLLDGNLPCEQIAAAAAWCGGWDNAELCLVIEPADEQLLLGTEASGADYLSDEQLEDCDGFVIIGDAFAANPMCSRRIFDRRAKAPRTPIVVIDPAGGSAAKFATHGVQVNPGMELRALRAVSAAAGVGAGEMPKGGQIPSGPRDAAGGEFPSAVSAGKALAGCKRLGVLVAAEYGRNSSWRQIGLEAGRLARGLGGGVAAQTTGANALAAVRLSAKLGTTPLAQALCGQSDLRIAVGCDVLGMLGRPDIEVFAAAAPLPNCTTQAAQVVLPLALPGEFGGTYVFSGDRPTETAALIPAPAGVPSPAVLVTALASVGGATPPPPQAEAAVPELERLGHPASQHSGRRQESAADTPPAPAQGTSAVRATADPGGMTLLLAREAKHAGCGALTASGSWQKAIEPLPELRISEQDARRLGIKNLAAVIVRVEGADGGVERSVRAQARLAPELTPALLVLPEGSAQTRALMPARIDPANGAVVAEPIRASVSAAGCWEPEASMT